MLKSIILSATVGVLFSACAQHEDIVQEKKAAMKVHEKFTLNDFLSDNEKLDSVVFNTLKNLDDTAIVAQLLMPAVGRYGDPETTIDFLVRKRMIGGLLLLNGTKEQCTSWVKKYNSITDTLLNLPFLYSADAEPTLFNRKISGTPLVKKANEIQSLSEVEEVAQIISSELNQIGINYNFSPVVDMSTNSTVGYRGFGKNPENIIPWSWAFIEKTQTMNIIATAKHFPGHGLVSGDTHKSLQVIDGQLQEIKNYPPLIDKGLLSIMIGHLAVKNNDVYDTKGLPATISKSIVTDLLITEMKFKGLIVTDAMNMGGVTTFPKAERRAIEAGCDIVLMPQNTAQAFEDMILKYRSDAQFKARVDESAAKVIRMKVCLGLLN
jgi:beta-N-acetylhexosaminidase